MSWAKIALIVFIMAILVSISQVAKSFPQKSLLIPDPAVTRVWNCDELKYIVIRSGYNTFYWDYKDAIYLEHVFVSMNEAFEAQTMIDIDLARLEGREC